MNREIKFRGKILDNQEWVYGSLIHRKEGTAENQKEYSAIVLFYKGLDSQYNAYLELEIIPESICQFTGLKDKNGADIYEGDIVNVKGRKRIKNYVTEIIWFNNGFCLKENKTYFNDYKLLSGALEIIGNIHENPELLNHD